MIVGSMAGPLAAAGGFCAGSDEIVEHQRLSAASYTYSAALPAMSATTASETLMLLQTQGRLIEELRERTRDLWVQLDPRSDWVTCTSAPENPILLLVLKSEVVNSRRLTVEDQQVLLQEIVDECLAQGVLVTRTKHLAAGGMGKSEIFVPRPSLKVCVTIGLSRKETEKAGTVIRHAVTKIMGRKR
jgi:serine palmitoyltransferase